MSDAIDERSFFSVGVPAQDALAPPDYCDPVVDAYKKDVDRTLLRENLKLTVEDRFRKFKSFARFARELHEAGQRSRSGR